MTRWVPALVLSAAGIGCAFGYEGDGEGDEGVDAAASATHSDAPSCLPVPETCNGLDDDCDSQIDEDFADLGQPCDGPDADLCNEGTWVCGTPSTLVCDDDSPDAVETCNGADDDCDGMVDDGLGRTYELTTGPVSSIGDICCSAGDTVSAVVDCGVGNNHTAYIQDTCGVAQEFNGNGGDACARITCTGACEP
jgi:hypothetical protein